MSIRVGRVKKITGDTSFQTKNLVNAVLCNKYIGKNSNKRNLNQTFLFMGLKRSTSRDYSSARNEFNFFVLN